MDFEDYLGEVRRRLEVRPAEKETVLSELRSHLWEKLEDLRRRRPHADEEQLMRHVLRDFGAPGDVAAAYGATAPAVPAAPPASMLQRVEGGVQRAGTQVAHASRRAAKTARATGHRAYRWAEARAPRAAKAARGVARSLARVLVLLWQAALRLVVALFRFTGRVVRFTAVSMLVVLAMAAVAATFAGLVLFDDIRAEIGAQESQQLLSFTESCARPCDRAAGPVLFYVSGAANRLTFQLQGSLHEDSHGSARVTVNSPSGVTVHEAELNAAGPARLSERHSWLPEVGYWELRVDSHGFQGNLHADAFVRGVAV